MVGEEAAPMRIASTTTDGRCSGLRRRFSGLETRMRAALLRQAVHRGRPAAVIDANLLRKAAVVEARQARFRSHGEQLVIADAVWNEVVANDTWESTLRASFSHLSREPEALVASWSVRAMIAGEESTGEPAREVVHAPMTAFLRQLVVNVEGGASETMAGLREAIRKHGHVDKRALAVLRKEATQKLVELGTQNIEPSRLKSVKTAMQSGDRVAFLDLVAEAFEPAKVTGALVRQQVDPQIADRLTGAPSVTVVHNLFLAHMGLEWTCMPGIKNAKLGRVHNDYVDVEYAVVAWACGGEYVTEDKRAWRRFDEVLGLCRRIWP